QMTNAIKPALSIVQKEKETQGKGRPHEFWERLKDEHKAWIEEMFEKAFEEAEVMAARDLNKRPDKLTCLYRVFNKNRPPKDLPMLWEGIASREFIRRYGV
ncbi:hypothetical protein D6779_02290, partial [Candidatus Parcubacteria bacterium]